VTLLEATRTLGGRARRIEPGGEVSLDNGQHILIGAYSDCLTLMRTVGVEPARALARSPLSLTFADGTGLQVPAGGPPWNVLRAVLGHAHWSWAEKLGFLRVASRWQLQGFRCRASVSVAQLCTGLPKKVWAEVIEPLCVSALNTPASEASGQVFLRVLKDALFSAPGSADLLLPRVDLSALLPDAAARWLQGRGHQVLTGMRVTRLSRDAAGWQLDSLPEQAFHSLIVATPPLEAARLLDGWSPGWAAQARALRYEPITTVYAKASGPLPRTMTALRASDQHPAQYVFDRSQLYGPHGADPHPLLAFVVSASAAWIGDGHARIEQAVVAQAKAELGLAVTPLRTVTEKRATFACTPELQRPATSPPGAPAVAAAGDYVNGPYPATLEGAVRSGVSAAAAVTQAATAA
jgi:squalene-associated FAD-dependent desaturase